MFFSAKQKELRKLQLCGNDLPWVNEGKHLGVNIHTSIDNLLGRDIKEKRAQYIQRNNELLQEFAFASNQTKMKINRI